jgi:DNA repair exonuclease SbcCD ATPase subunit
MAVVICSRLEMSEEERLAQHRARLVSLRSQRTRMAHRGSELERRAEAEVQGRRRELEQARAELAHARESTASLRADLDAFERDLAGRRLVADARGPEWQSAWEQADAGLREAQERRGDLEARTGALEDRLRQALRDQEAAAAERSRAVAEIDHEIDHLMREIGRLQAERPLPEAPDPQFRDRLLDRLRYLEAERTWVGEEIAVREERLRRITMEAGHIRSLLELHTPDWGREALASIAAEPESERSRPPWRQAVVEILERASEPMRYRDIADQLQNVGKALGGQDPAETLLAALTRDAGFERVGRGTYWLAGRPLPAGWRASGRRGG